MNKAPTYRGRFAPSPTGPLHFGSLVAALGSYLDARSHGGIWLVRMEDLDPPRTQSGAADSILRTLEAYGLEWNGEILYQSTRSSAYAAALNQLQSDDHCFACACTRREIADSALALGGEAIYPGTCRSGLPQGRIARAVRVRVDDRIINCVDRVQGSTGHDLTRECGDFVVQRADGLFAYQLAVVVDDASQGITHIVRGADLLDSTPRQIYLQQLLGLSTPSYAHLPAAINARGEKLSKQTLAKAIDPQHAVPTLLRALQFLGQQPPDELASVSLRELWTWAVSHWRLDRVPTTRTQPAPEDTCA